MIVLYHKNYKISKIVSAETDNFPKYINKNIVAVLLEFAIKFKDEILIWCHESEHDNLNLEGIQQLFHHKKFLCSYNPSSENYFDRRLGYIEDSPFITIRRNVTYATWQMSSHVGAVHASVINACMNDLKVESNFDYFLNSFARRAMNHGLFCYSEPRLLIQESTEKISPKADIQELFKFTKQHYRTRWVFLLFLNSMLFEKKFLFKPFLMSLFYAKRTLNPERLHQIPLESNKKIIEKGTIDVLIPTIGRKQYLHDVLQNLASQTYLPKNIIIIEQNPNPDSSSELDYIQNQQWPFTIKHHFTHRTGACNARNIGLSLVESEFTFFADDDIVFENDLLQKAMQIFQSTGNEVFLISCLLASQSVVPQPPRQFAVFGAGHAFVKSDCFKNIRFNTGYEFGFGEDNDFGMQLRLKGFDILYISTEKILHLKAPIGGFRTKPLVQWQHDEIQPKPSPTLMLFRILYDTEEQLANYKTTLFFKNLNKSFFLNPIKYLKTFRQKWDRSIFWANELNKQKS